MGKRQGQARTGALQVTQLGSHVRTALRYELASARPLLQPYHPTVHVSALVSVCLHCYMIKYAAEHYALPLAHTAASLLPNTELCQARDTSLQLQHTSWHSNIMYTCGDQPALGIVKAHTN